MSGGSFDYVCFRDSYNILEHLGDLHQMVKYLKGLEGDIDGDMIEDCNSVKDLAKEVEILWLDLRSFKTMIQTRLDRLQPILKAVEWEASGDTCREDTLKAWKKFMEGKGK